MLTALRALSITAVGATQNIPEVAAPYSSGGFSNIFPRPDYQTDAVGGYLQALGTVDEGLFNNTGRAYPDVSMQGTDFLLVSNGTNVPDFSGTSCAAPSFASLVALVNDRLLAADQPPLGFLNPLIYQAGASVFNDITEGSNPGCGTQGFPAAEGWDPVTGMGTADFVKMLNVAMSSSARATPSPISVPASDTASASASASATSQTTPPAAPSSSSEDSAEEIESLVGAIVQFLQGLVNG